MTRSRSPSSTATGSRHPPHHLRPGARREHVVSAFDDDEDWITGLRRVEAELGLSRHVDTELELLENVRNLEQRLRAHRRRPRSRVIGHADQLPAEELRALAERVDAAAARDEYTVEVSTLTLGALLAEVRRGRTR